MILSAAERATLQNWAGRPKSAQALALRARMILRCAEGRTNTQVAGQVQVRIATVGKWRQRFVERRLARRVWPRFIQQSFQPSNPA